MVPEAEHEAHPQDPFLGAVVDGRYRLIGLLLPLERGAVYRAVEDPAGQEVALRVFLHGVKDEAREEERYRREAEQLIRLRNPGVVGVLAYGTGQGIHWATFELVRAEALAQGLQRGPLAWNQALGLTQHLLAGLDAAHRVGFLHGELTPANILIIQEQAGLRARLAGLGTNRMFGVELQAAISRGASDPSLLRPGLVEYLSPEQIEGKHLGPWSDVYSLGAVLFHMLAGRPPVTAADPMAVVQAHLAGQLPRLEPAYPCPQPVIDLVTRALARAPAHRYPDARSMYEEISAILAAPQLPMVPGTQGTAGRTATGGQRPVSAEVASHRPAGPGVGAPPATRVLERAGELASPAMAERGSIELSAVRPSSGPPVPRPVVPTAGGGADASSTMDIEIDEVQDVDFEPDDTGRSQGLPRGATGGRASGTMDIDEEEIQELRQDPPDRGARAGREPAVAPSRAPVFAAAPVRAATPTAAGPSYQPVPATTRAQPVATPVAEPMRSMPSPAAQSPARAPVEPAAGPFKPLPPELAKNVSDPEKATLLVDVDELEMARLQQEFSAGSAAAGGPEASPDSARSGKRPLPLPLPAMIGVGALAVALLVVVIVVGVKWVHSLRPTTVEAPSSKALELFAGLTDNAGSLPAEDVEPTEALGETPKSAAEWRTLAEERVKEVNRRDAEVTRQINAMIQQARVVIEQVPTKDRPSAHRLARELVGLSTTRRGLSGEAAQLKAALRRADGEKLEGIAANAWTLRSNLMEVLGYSQSAYDELQELVRPSGPADEAAPTAVAAAGGDAEPSTAEPRQTTPLTIAVSEPTTGRTTGGLREVAPSTPVAPAVSSTISVLPTAQPRRTEQPVDPEIGALIASVRPAAATPIPAPRTAAPTITPASAPATPPQTALASLDPGRGSVASSGAEAGFAPVTSSPSRIPVKGAARKDAASGESDEELLMRILGSPREGPIVVSGEQCPCNHANVESAARSGGRGMTECELRACEKVPPGTHHFSDINLNLASYFFQQRNLRREFEALYRATSYGSYKHDPQVLAAYIKVAVRLKRFQVALQAKDRFLFVQDKLPPDQRRPKVAEIYRILAQAFEHQFYRQKERKPKSTDFTYLNRAIDFWERFADYSGQRGQADQTIAELKKLRRELEQE